MNQQRSTTPLLLHNMTVNLSGEKGQPLQSTTTTRARATTIHNPSITHPARPAARLFPVRIPARHAHPITRFPRPLALNRLNLKSPALVNHPIRARFTLHNLGIAVFRLPERIEQLRDPSPIHPVVQLQRNPIAHRRTNARANTTRRRVVPERRLRTTNTLPNRRVLQIALVLTRNFQPRAIPRHKGVLRRIAPPPPHIDHLGPTPTIHLHTTRRRANPDLPLNLLHRARRAPNTRITLALRLAQPRIPAVNPREHHPDQNGQHNAQRYSPQQTEPETPHQPITTRSPRLSRATRPSRAFPTHLQRPCHQNHPDNPTPTRKPPFNSSFSPGP